MSEPSAGGSSGGATAGGEASGSEATDNKVPASPQTPERMADLHAHSTASDGAATPVELVQQARQAGLSTVAVTDHDTVEGVGAARAAGDGLGLTVVAGVELSAVDGEQEIHILGLHLEDPHTLAPLLAELRDSRRRRAATMVSALRAAGIPLTIEAVMVEAGEGAVGRPHVARALMAGGWVRDQRDAFDRFLGAGRPAFVPKRHLALSDAIRLVHAAGGIAVYAHPGRDGIRSRLEAFRGMGLDGIEVLHPGHSAEDVARLRALSDFLQLVPSGGSDWHGGTEGPRALGSMRVPEAWVDRQMERAQAYRGSGSGSWSSATASHS